MKGKDVILSNFLLRQTHNHSNPHDIIPMSFNMHNILHEKYYKIEVKERYLVHTILQTKSSRVTIPEVYGAKMILDMNILPEKQKVVLQNEKIIENKPRGRARIRHNKPQLVERITASASKSCEIPKIPMTQNVTKNRMDFPV